MLLKIILDSFICLILKSSFLKKTKHGPNRKIVLSDTTNSVVRANQITVLPVDEAK